MELDKDFKEFLQLLNTYKVEYLVVGGYAVAFHGHPRYTGDIDIWVNPNQNNAKNLIKAIDSFGYETDELQKMDFSQHTIAFHIGAPPLRIDIMNKVSGVKFDECYISREILIINEIEIPYIGYQDLLKNKKASGRLQDLSDLEKLQ